MFVISLNTMSDVPENWFMANVFYDALMTLIMHPSHRMRSTYFKDALMHYSVVCSCKLAKKKWYKVHLLLWKFVVLLVIGFRCKSHLEISTKPNYLYLFIYYIKLMSRNPIKSLNYRGNEIGIFLINFLEGNYIPISNSLKKLCNVLSIVTKKNIAFNSNCQ